MRRALSDAMEKGGSVGRGKYIFTACAVTFSTSTTTSTTSSTTTFTTSAATSATNLTSTTTCTSKSIPVTRTKTTHVVSDGGAFVFFGCPNPNHWGSV